MLRTIIALALALSAFAAVAPVSAQSTPLPCDLNADGKVTAADLQIIRANIGMGTFPGDPLDPNGDGKITMQDVRFCTLRCTFASCAES